MDECYDVAQICLNGHVINDSCKDYPQHNKKFCQVCGEQTITKCQSCSSDIQGVYIVRGVIQINELQKAPAYCHSCGKPYPWTDRNIEAAIDLFIESGKLNETELEQTKQDIRNIARDIPQAEPSAMRIKKRLKTCGIVAYNVIIEFASKTAAQILKNP
jgi:hypothetical protein